MRILNLLHQLLRRDASTSRNISVPSSPSPLVPVRAPVGLSSTHSRFLVNFKAYIRYPTRCLYGQNRLYFWCGMKTDARRVKEGGLALRDFCGVNGQPSVTAPTTTSTQASSPGYRASSRVAGVPIPRLAQLSPFWRHGTSILYFHAHKQSSRLGNTSVVVYLSPPMSELHKPSSACCLGSQP